jgi:diguanylate cyclase (GGDEF)-like protein
MSPRPALIVVGLTAVLGLLAGVIGELEKGPMAGIGMPVALALIAFVSAQGVWKTSQSVAARRVARRTDPLTGLPNGAQLRADAGLFLDKRATEDQRALLIFDLVGFKKYNDAFGFACGDVLLRRLAGKLVLAIGDMGIPYRLRGAQFAVVTTPDMSARVRTAATDALFETGEGFMIRCAQGSVVIPHVAVRDISEALKLADQEVQSERAALRSSHGADEVSAGSAMLEQSRGASSSPYDITEVAVSVGQCLGLGSEELDHLEMAVTLRDVGMMAVPGDILSSAGRLGDDDWRFVQLHTLVGERLLRANFGMNHVASVVRSSHERWDGGGYPDALAGEDIPISARIVFVCGAFQDMTTQRPHRPALTAHQALLEVERCAGTQFDPAVAAAFVGVFSDRVDKQPGAQSTPRAPGA